MEGSGEETDRGGLVDPEWVEECLRTYGRVLTGEYAHRCPEWDGMPVDETCLEWTVCVCGWPSGYSGRKSEG